MYWLAYCLRLNAGKRQYASVPFITTGQKDQSSSSKSTVLERGDELFNVGDVVVYPLHGAGVIEQIDERQIEGIRKKYLILSLSQGNLKVTVPAEKTDEVGLRNVISKREVMQVINTLKEESTPMPSNWNHRFKKNHDKLRSGDVYEVAEVVRNLTLRDKEKGLSAGEKRMLQQAKDILISEIIFAVKGDRKKACDMIDRAFNSCN
jgi:CarD family transcriptional regulator